MRVDLKKMPVLFQCDIADSPQNWRKCLCTCLHYRSLPDTNKLLLVQYLGLQNVAIAIL